MRHNPRRLASLIVVATVVTLSAIPAAVAGVHAQDNVTPIEETESYYTPMPCPSGFSGFSANYGGHAWVGSWRKDRPTNLVHIAWYKGVENPFVSLTRKWEWLNPEGMFSCNYHVIIPPDTHHG